MKSWRAAGIIPVFANGNSGPQCGTVNSPGDYSDVIGVGASAVDDTLASFSSVGPSRRGIIKPDVSAPGLNVRSAWHTSDSSFKSISGTSMATPHTAGVIALLLSHQSNLSYDRIYSSLSSTCSTAVLKGPGKSCGGVSETTFPNNAFGYGVIHASNALASLDGKNPTPAPSSYTPAPTPTTPAPITCEGNFFSCRPRDLCRWSWSDWSCVRK